jgi:hypothetical protein
MGRIARLLVAVAFVTTGAALTPASIAGAIEAPTRPAAAPPSLPELPSVNPASPSLSAGGRAMLETASLEGAPRYAVSATLEPDTGNVAGRMHARVRADDDKLEFRVLAGLPALRAGLRVRDVTVNNKKVQPEVDRALLRVPVKRGAPRSVDVRLQFSYRVPRQGSTTGRPLSQETIGVLSRTLDFTLLGHWFPLWLPPGADADPALSGFGDIGNFAAGAITARLQVPTGYEVVSGGVTSDRSDDGRRATVTESGVGLRDLAFAVGRGLRSATTAAGDVTVRVTGAAGLDLESVAPEAAADLQTLADLYAPYPWAEIDVVAAPLGADVGGMWWHALVGNDSIRAPVVDEPLAQFSMCVVLEQRQGAGGGECAAIGSGLGTGRRDACADRPTTGFKSAQEYGSLIYDQAPGFYFALSNAVGRDATIAALRAVVARHAFGVVDPTQLRDELVGAFPDRATEVRDLWDRYIGPPGCGS